MNSIGFTPNYSSNVRNNNNVHFKGALGEKFVSKMAHGEAVKTEEVMNAVKGAFSPKTEKVADVVESLLGRVQVLSSSNEANLKGRQIAESKLAEVPNQLRDTENKVRQNEREYWTGVVRAKENELAAKDKELQAAKEYAAKYEPMSKVKSVAELDTVLPEEAIQTFKDMVEHKHEALDSMHTYLMTGKGQEAALAQVERNNKLLKAHEDGMMMIDDVKAASQEAGKEGIYYTYPAGFTIRMIGDSLKGNPKGAYISSHVIRNQVKTNAMGLLTPMTDGCYNTDFSKALDKTFEEVEVFHKGYAKGIEKIKKSGQKLEGEPIPYELDKESLTLTENGSSWPVSPQQVANRGNSSWS